MYEKYQNLLNRDKVTSYQVSKCTGISETTLSDWKSGRSKPKADKLKKLADYFGVSIEYFLEEEE